MSYVTDTRGERAYLGGVDMELDGCGCLTSEEHMTRCVLTPAAGVVTARPTESSEERRRRLNRERVQRFKVAHPERWREIQRASEARRRAA